MKAPRTSVIVPVYNGESYLQRCLDSIYSQSDDDYEIIIINDGSNDGTLRIIESNQKKYSKIRLINQDNKGQGLARNLGLKKAEGEYILFVDSDDYIDSSTIEKTVAKIENDNADFVHFGWEYDGPKVQGASEFITKGFTPYEGKSLLKNAECDELLGMTHYFSTNNLYRKSFLLDNDIEFGGGSLYEDNVFITRIANMANRVSIISENLYRVVRNRTSTTRSGYEDNRHAMAFMNAVEACVETLQPRTQYSTYYLARYFQTKFIFYYTRRVPFRYRNQYLKKYVDLTSKLKNITIPDNSQPERILKLCLKHRIFENHKYTAFKAIIIYKTRILPVRDVVRDAVKKIRHNRSGK